MVIKVTVAGALITARPVGATVSQESETKTSKEAVPPTLTLAVGTGMPGLQLHEILEGETEIGWAVGRRGFVTVRTIPTGVPTGGPTVSVTLIVTAISDPPGIAGVIVTVAL